MKIPPPRRPGIFWYGLYIFFLFRKGFKNSSAPLQWPLNSWTFKSAILISKYWDRQQCPQYPVVTHLDSSSPSWRKSDAHQNSHQLWSVPHSALLGISLTFILRQSKIHSLLITDSVLESVCRRVEAPQPLLTAFNVWWLARAFGDSLRYPSLLCSALCTQGLITNFSYEAHYDKPTVGCSGFLSHPYWEVNP